MKTFDVKKRSTMSFEVWEKNYKKMQTANQIKKGEADITADGMLGDVKGKDGRADLSNPKDVIDKKKHIATKETYGGAVKGKEGYETELDESENIVVEAVETNGPRKLISEYLKKFGLEDIRVPDEFPEGGKWTNSAQLKLNNLGPLSPMIKDCLVKYAFAFHPQDNQIYLNLVYEYKHPSGSNGYKVILIFDNNGKYLKSMKGGFV